MICPTCQTSNAEGARFCSNCGTPLSAPQKLEGERKLVTVMFADVAGSTALAERLDPEEWAGIMNGAFAFMNAAVARYGGTVSRLMGDAVLALFGAPAAHENDAERAARAALSIQESAARYADTVREHHGIEFALRIGINTGTAVLAFVGDATRSEYTAMGDVANVAARLQSMAAPGAIVIGTETQRLIAPLFETEALGDVELKGKQDKVSASRLLGAREQPGPQRGIEGVSARLIGRDIELARLKTALDSAIQGRGQIVTLIGEAGLGKSRLLAEAERYWKEVGPANEWSRMAGVPYDTMRPYGLLQNFARSMFGIELTDPPHLIHDKIQRRLCTMGISDNQVALCSLAMEKVIAAKALSDAPDFDPQVVRQDLYDNMYPAMRQSAATEPHVVACEDLHWADQASVELMMHLMGLVDEVPIVFLCAFRPERQSPAWQVKHRADTDFPHRHTEIVLRPLGEHDVGELVGELLDVEGLPDELRQLIVRKADGNPYFVEEIVRSLIDDGAIVRSDRGLSWRAGSNVSDITIPESLQALLLARIDRLDQDTKSTLQMASVIGRSFQYRILQTISDTALTLDKHLGSLERVELLREASRRPELEYMFRHELTRDAAYGSILNRRRQEVHRQVGEAIEVLFADRLEEQAHRLAQHFKLAGDDDKALRYFEMAGDTAASLHAVAESRAHFDQAEHAARQLKLGPEVLTRINAKRAAIAQPA